MENGVGEPPGLVAQLLLCDQAGKGRRGKAQQHRDDRQRDDEFDERDATAT